MSGGPSPDLPPDPVIEAYKKDVDRTLLSFMRSIDRLREAARGAR